MVVEKPFISSQSPAAGKWPAVALDDLELLGHHGGRPDVEVESVDSVEPLVREGDLPDLTRLDQSQHAQGAVMDRLLVEFA